MSINNFEGDTFVAFLDIAGFKMLKKDKAWRALDKLYESGYDILKRQNRSNGCRGVGVEGIFISDCGILFVRNNPRDDKNHRPEVLLEVLLKAIKVINQEMLKSNFMLTTSVAYGSFKYQERIEFLGIEKNPICGDAYVSAFLDNERWSPRIKPGQCRIVKENLPKYITRAIDRAIKESKDNETFRMIRKRDGDNKHYYYYWMVNNHSEIERFEQDYKDTYKFIYAGMLEALKGVRH